MHREKEAKLNFGISERIVDICAPSIEAIKLVTSFVALLLFS